MTENADYGWSQVAVIRDFGSILLDTSHGPIPTAKILALQSAMFVIIVRVVCNAGKNNLFNATLRTKSLQDVIRIAARLSFDCCGLTR